jgi:hypothetical protein
VQVDRASSQRLRAKQSADEEQLRSYEKALEKVNTTVARPKPRPTTAPVSR